MSVGAWDSLARLKREFLFLIALEISLLSQGSEGLAFDSLWGIDISIICRKSDFQFEMDMLIFSMFSSSSQSIVSISSIAREKSAES